MGDASVGQVNPLLATIALLCAFMAGVFVCWGWTHLEAITFWFGCVLVAAAVGAVVVG